jgi:hypothetical protein
MTVPAWKRLIEELKDDSGRKGPHFDRVRERLPPGMGLQSLAAELLREMGSALARAEDKVETALRELEQQGRAIDALLEQGGGADGAGEIRSRVAAWNRQREVAEKALWELRVHREALGFRRHEDLAERYRIPPKRA